MALINASQPVGRRRRWLTYGGLLLVVALAWPAWRQIDSARRESAGLAAMADGEYAKAAAILELASAAYPGDQDLAFLAAVAYRRDGNGDKLEEFLRRAERLGYPTAEIRLQRLLSLTQHGLADEDSEAELNRICAEGASDFTAEQIYEARAKGYMSVYQINRAFQALAFWIEWQPRAVVPRLLRAQLYEQNDDISRAQEDYRAVIETHSSHVEARILLAQSLLISHKYEQALAHMEACSKVAPDDPRVKLVLAEIEFRSGGDLSRVERTLKKLIDVKIDREVRQQALVLLANIHLNRKEYDKVVSLLEEAGTTGELDVPAYQTLARAYSFLNQRDKAQRYLDLQAENLKRRDEIYELYERIRKNPSDPDARYRMGRFFYDAGDKKGALTWWYTAVLAEPLHQESHEALADYYTSQGDLKRATQHLALAERAVERTFKLAWDEYTSDDLLAVQQRIPSIAKYPAYKPHAELLEFALELNSKQRQLDPARLEALRPLLDYPRLRNHVLTLLGAGMFQLGRFGEAEEALLDVIHNDPWSIEAHRWLAAMNFDIRVLDRLYYHCDQWARLDPDDYRPHRLMGLESKLRQAFAPAIEAYQESLRRNPYQKTREEVLLELAECQYRSGKVEEALKTIDLSADSLQRDVLRAQCLLAVQRRDEAKQLLAQILEREPKNMMANMLRADIAVQEDDSQLAAEHLKIVTAEYPSNHSGWFKLSQVYKKLNVPDKAREASEKSEYLRGIETRFFELMEKAIQLPKDVGIRRELGALSRQLGRADLAEEWDRAAELLVSQQKTEAQTAAKKEPNSLPLEERRSLPPLIVPDGATGP
jgi:tetratricopeptide (TPR) repeat protein